MLNMDFQGKFWSEHKKYKTAHTRLDNGGNSIPWNTHGKYNGEIEDHWCLGRESRKES